MTHTIAGLFESHRVADLVVEHLVQEYGVPREYVRVYAMDAASAAEARSPQDNDQGTSLSDLGLSEEKVRAYTEGLGRAAFSLLPKSKTAGSSASWRPTGNTVPQTSMHVRPSDPSAGSGVTHGSQVIGSRYQTCKPERARPCCRVGSKGGLEPRAVRRRVLLCGGIEGFLLAFIDGEPVASISVVRYGSDFGFLGLYIVRPDYVDGVMATNSGRPAWRSSASARSGSTASWPSKNYRRSGFRLAHRNIRYGGQPRIDAPRRRQGQRRGGRASSLLFWRTIPHSFQHSQKLPALLA